ncbi:MAG: hypothetical protein QXF12_00075 [Candidatus Aenigmatarchaeota archaeon]
MIEYRKVRFEPTNREKRELRNFSKRASVYSAATAADYAKDVGVANIFAPAIKRLARIISLHRTTSGKKAQVSRIDRQIIDGTTRFAFKYMFINFCGNYRISPTKAASLLANEKDYLLKEIYDFDNQELSDEELEQILNEEETYEELGESADQSVLLDRAYKAYESALIWSRSFLNFMFSSILASEIRKFLSKKYGRGKSLNMTFENVGKIPFRALFNSIRNLVRLLFNRLGYKDEVEEVMVGLPEKVRKGIEKYDQKYGQAGGALDLYKYLAAQAVVSMFPHLGVRSLSNFGVNYVLFVKGQYLVNRFMESVVNKISDGVLTEFVQDAAPSEMSKALFTINYLKVKPSRRAFSIANKVIGNMRYFSGSKKERLVKALLREFRKYFSEHEMQELEEEITVTINRADAYQLISSLSDLTAKLSEMLLGEVERTERQTVDNDRYDSYEDEEPEDEEDTEDLEPQDEDPEDEEDTQDEEPEDEEDTEDEEERKYRRSYYSRKRKVAKRKVRSPRRTYRRRKKSDNKNVNFFDLEEIRRKIYR